MKKRDKLVEPVKGGYVLRDAATGRFHAVETTTGERKTLTSSSRTSVLTVSDRRSAALRRLADR